MARRSIPPPKPKPPVLTVGQKRRRIERLQKCIQRLEAFDPQKVQKRVGVPEVLALEAAIDKALSSAFGYGTPPYIRYNLAATLDPVPLITKDALRSTVRPVGGPRRRDAQAQEARQYFSEGKERSITLLREAICTLEGGIADAQPVVKVAQESKATQKAGEVRTLRTVATLNESLPGDSAPPLAGQTDESEALNSASVLKSGLWGVSIDLKAAWRRVGRWWRGRN